MLLWLCFDIFLRLEKNSELKTIWVTSPHLNDAMLLSALNWIIWQSHSLGSICAQFSLKNVWNEHLLSAKFPRNREAAEDSRREQKRAAKKTAGESKKRPQKSKRHQSCARSHKPSAEWFPNTALTFSLQKTLICYIIAGSSYLWDDFYIICFWKKICYIQIYRSKSHTKWAGQAF